MRNQGSLMPIDFEWPVDTKGYAVSGWGTRPMIKRLGGKLAMKRPLAHHPVLFREFAFLPDVGTLSEKFGEACVAFATSYGLLGVTQPKNPSDGEALINWSAEAASMAQQLAMKPDELIERQGDPANVEARIVKGSVGQPRLALRPKSLLSAMRLQFFQSVGSGSGVRVCEFCGAWFETGVGHRRPMARFCSDACRVNFHNQRRSKEAKP